MEGRRLEGRPLGPHLLNAAQRVAQLREPRVGVLTSQPDAPGERVAAAAGNAGIHQSVEHAPFGLAEHRFRRKVAWGARCAEHSEMFTTLSVPVMTRLRQSERRVLDTLVDSGVARSRSDALAWCVRLTGEHADSWLTELRDALRRVEQVRSQGPAF